MKRTQQVYKESMAIAACFSNSDLSLFGFWIIKYKSHVGQKIPGHTLLCFTTASMKKKKTKEKKHPGIWLCKNKLFAN